jgi:glycosyltransferase involved in cell wall biosynthesis
VGGSPDAWAVTQFKNIVQFQNIAAVYVNTLVLREPLMAARQAGVPSMLHVRESLEHDPDMCRAFRMSADEIRARVLASADVIVANSGFTAGNFRKKDATFVVTNIVDPALFKLHNPVDPRCIHVAMISSNQPKKGLSDFVELARVLAYDWGALPELIEHGETGFLVPYKDIQAAAERIRFLCDNLARITLMGARGRIKARNYNIQTMKHQLQTVFEGSGFPYV